MRPSCVLLLSGGIDSGALLFWALNSGYKVLPLYVNYGQIPAPGESQAVHRLLHSAGQSSVSPVDIPQIARLIADGSIHNAPHPPLSHYFPSRNMLLITLAAMHAYENNLDRIMIGLIANSAPALPDCSVEFLHLVQTALHLEYPSLQIVAPFITRSKLEIVLEAAKFGFDPYMTFSCHILADHHCWQCPGCLDRMQVLDSFDPRQ